LSRVACASTVSSPERARLEGLEDRPDLEERVDPLLRHLERLAIRVADTLPILHDDPSDSFRHDPGKIVGWRYRATFTGFRGREARRIGPRSHHDGSGERLDEEPHAVAEVEPARLGREVQSEHQ
jgi:hypothetical protein